MKDKLLQVCGLAKRAGKICFGETLFKKFSSNQVHYLIICEDISERSFKQLTNKAFYYQVEYIQILTSSELSYAIGKRNIKAIGITDINFKQLIKKVLQKEENDG